MFLNINRSSNYCFWISRKLCQLPFYSGNFYCFSFLKKIISPLLQRVAYHCVPVWILQWFWAWWYGRTSVCTWSSHLHACQQTSHPRTRLKSHKNHLQHSVRSLHLWGPGSPDKFNNNMKKISFFLKTTFFQCLECMGHILNTYSIYKVHDMSVFELPCHC